MPAPARDERIERPRIGAFGEPSARTYRQWTPQLLRAAEIAADDGALQLAADLCDAMLADDRIKAVLDSRTDALLGRDLDFEAGTGRARRRAVKALALEEDWWAAFPETALKLLHAWGVMLGVGVAELQWREDPDHGGRLIPHLEVKHPRHLRFDAFSRTWKLTVLSGESGSATTEIEIRPGDGKWLIYTPYGPNRPWTYGAYRALSRWSLLKRYAIADWGFYSERHGLGLLLVSGAEGSKEQRREIAADLARIGRNAGFALPKGFDMKLLEATANTWQTYVAQISAADNGAAVTILGQNLTTQISPGDGSRAAASEHGKVALGRTKADAETLATTLHDQVLDWWALFNFGDRRLAPWPLWDTSPTEDIKDRAATLQMLGQFITAAAPLYGQIDVRALLEDFGVPLLAPNAEPQLRPAAEKAPAPSEAA
jgi:phage gp29-like protein